MKIISFYTDDWEYPRHAKRLRAECGSLGIDNYIVELPSTGSYLKNTCLKPRFILDCLMKFKEPVLWIDVDASILDYPHLAGILEVDFAARMMAEDRARTWHVGTMWFNYTQAMVIFLESWIENTGKLSDESALEKTWSDNGWMLTTHSLPPEYFYIIRYRHHMIPEGTIIAHRISSGESKKNELPGAIEYAKNGGW